MPSRHRRWDEEADAQRVLVAILGGEAVQRDPGGGPVPTHDFDIHFPDGRIVAVEVTRHNVPAEVQQHAAIARDNPRFPQLRYDWHLGTARRVDVRGLRRAAPDLLAALEEMGIDVAHLNRQAPSDENAALAGLRGLGVRLVYRLTEADDAGGIVDIGDAPFARSTAPEVAVLAVEQAARRKLKAEKLAAAAADERHLFVWAESSADDVVATMGFGFLPDRAPVLPDRIDVVWLATAYEYPHVWRYGSTGWSDRGYPTKPPRP